MIRSIYIPTIGTKLKTKHDWKFLLYMEFRNMDFATHMGVAIHERYEVNSKPLTVILPAQTYLTVGRIYIRGSARAFDSVTFNLRSSPMDCLRPEKLGGTRKGTCRFWVKLDEVQGLDVEETDEAPPFMKQVWF